LWVIIEFLRLRRVAQRLQIWYSSDKQQVNYRAVHEAEILERTISDPAILCGRLCIKGARVSVHFILELFASGAKREEIIEAYLHLTAEGVEEAFRYAVRSLKNDILLTAEVGS